MSWILSRSFRPSAVCDAMLSWHNIVVTYLRPALQIGIACSGYKGVKWRACPIFAILFLSSVARFLKTLCLIRSNLGPRPGCCIGTHLERAYGNARNMAGKEPLISFDGVDALCKERAVFADGWKHWSKVVIVPVCYEGPFA